jgi:transcriptional regulator with XRE-family HTH domain
MVDSLLTKIPVRYSFYDENVGHSAKEKGQTAQQDFLRYRHNIGFIIVVSTADETDGVFAARLRTAREQRELNQTELAKIAGLQPAAIGHFEANRRKPSFANIRALAKALEVSSDYLLGRADTIKGSTTAFRNEESLNHADRESIQLMIDTLARRREDREK